MCAQRLQGIQNEILEMIAYGEPLAVVTDALCRRIEEVAPEAICSVLAVDEAGILHPLAAPRLPEFYSAALDGISVGPMVGSCGTCAYRGEPVLVDDIDTDPLWADYKALAQPLGLRACWSSPIKARAGRVIGTFALYYRAKRGPTEIERLAVDTCVHLCAIAIEQTAINARNHRLAYFDTLTGLPNRFHADLLLRSKTTVRPKGLGLLIIDIDNLKVTNDTLGHAMGDELIRQVGRRIEKAVRPNAACRIGGDEFVAILTDCDPPERLRETAARILTSMGTPFEADGQAIVPHVTIGGALFGRDGDEIETLRQNADLALYKSKENGRGRFVEYGRELRTGMVRRMRLINELEAGFDEGRVVPYYQSVVRIDTGEIIGLEALARLKGRDGSILSAGYFQEVLGEPRIGHRLTGHMLPQVARDVRRWLDLGIPFQHVSINVAMADFQYDSFAKSIAAAFQAVDVPLEHVVLEVTETVFVGGPERGVAPTVKRLRDLGMRVALDDFGTGYASLTHLLTLPVDIIKIDKSFVDRLIGDTAGGVIITAMLDIARQLGIHVVAEGIETAEQADTLQSLGCVFGQGYLYDRAGSFEETTQRLLTRAQWIHGRWRAVLPKSRRVA